MVDIEQLADELGQALKAKQWVVTTAESCTGGGVSFAITDIPGSSVWFNRAFITYSNEAKKQMLSVTDQALVEFGAVSEAVVFEMACGALAASRADISVAISGIAGPDGGSDEKPVGTVWFAWADATGWQQTRSCLFSGSRQQVRQQAIAEALSGLIERVKSVIEE
ncbi:nicotinamide-nucleotide amidase [Photobacterium kishitanii]|uniref:Nicotinamide-nucleotide amidase n=1 Tax=Photobacterium kishitanii TaxID=318456 RepID=A0A0B7J9X6_9GAMM|nr:nicotinamide-nucleotide amidase [Photobacterium kishitanii]KJG09152.1 damage-inducible protein CinA [Photobacterium kishitanii]OBU26897.1 damage-inducible protein CinA [Photobacterium kishitanii]PSU89092.1 nicotinamide-nucleotide amidase [Photobacterium kishitanii]PSU96212.1 nicotinamide-nucleotide amidase [Photobacterium kishitanii]PSV04416.1 nicotinamide-nucleotide amidase [Photobacterium kishitanii]